MKPDATVMKNLLRKRKVELQKIINQMKQDELHSSTVFKNLSHELESVKTKITSSTKD